MILDKKQRRAIFSEIMSLSQNEVKKFSQEIIEIPNYLGIWSLDLGKDELSWDDNMFDICGRERKFGIPNHEEADNQFISTKDTSEYKKKINQLIDGSKEYVNYNITGQKPGGQDYMADIFAYPIKDEEGNVIEIRGYYMEKKTLNEKIDGTLKERLKLINNNDDGYNQALIKEKNALISYVFHEVRNPMNVIFLGLQDLKTIDFDNYDLNDINETIQVMYNSAQQALKILNDTLDYAKLESGNLHIERKMITLAKIIEGVVKENQSFAKINNVRLIVDIQTDIMFEGDEARMKQVFNNLINNGIKFNKQDGGYVKIILDFDSKRTMATVQIKDNGMGISEDAYDKIFKAYNNVNKNTSRKKGMGIGLSICRSILKSHYGHIYIKESKLGEGSTFEIKIPALQKIPLKTIKRRKGTVKDINILIVDDEDDNIFMMKRILQKKKCNVDCLYDGLEFLEYTRNPSKKYDLILLDHFMPNIDGSEALRLARSEGFDGFVVIITGNKMNSLQNYYKANDIIYKPIFIKQIEDLIIKHNL